MAVLVTLIVMQAVMAASIPLLVRPRPHEMPFVDAMCSFRPDVPGDVT